MRQFALGLAAGSAAALLAYLCVTSISPAAAQFERPVPAQPAAPNPPAGPVVPPPIPAARQPVGTYQVATSSYSQSTGPNSFSGHTITILVDTRTGDGYRLEATNRVQGNMWVQSPIVWEKYIHGPLR